MFPPKVEEPKNEVVTKPEEEKEETPTKAFRLHDVSFEVGDQVFIPLENYTTFHKDEKIGKICEIKNNQADIAFVPRSENRFRIFTYTKRDRQYVENCLGSENVVLVKIDHLINDCYMQIIKLDGLSFQDVVNALGGFIEEVIEIGEPPDGIRASYLQEEEEAE